MFRLLHPLLSGTSWSSYLLRISLSSALLCFIFSSIRFLLVALGSGFHVHLNYVSLNPFLWSTIGALSFIFPSRGPFGSVVYLCVSVLLGDGSRSASRHIQSRWSLEGESWCSCLVCVSSCLYLYFVLSLFPFRLLPHLRDYPRFPLTSCPVSFGRRR